MENSEEIGRQADDRAGKGGIASWLRRYYAPLFLAITLAALFTTSCSQQWSDEGQCGKLSGSSVSGVYPVNGTLLLGSGDTLCVEANDWQVAQAKTESRTGQKDALNPGDNGPNAGSTPESETTTPAACGVSGGKLVRCASGYVLKLDGVPIAIGEFYRPAPFYYRFALNRSEDASTDSAARDRQVWGGRVLDGIGSRGSAAAEVALCPSDGASEDCIVMPNAKLRVFFLSQVVLGFFALVAFLSCVVIAARRTGLIHDPVNGTYSLARAQILFWFTLVTASFMVIFMFTGQSNGVLTGSTVALMGIYTATGWVAANTTKPLPGVAGAQGESMLPSGRPRQSAGFFADILTDKINTDESTFGVHRLIMIVWSVILAILMIQSVLTRFAFPQFDYAMLTLAGVTGGAFAGFKAIGQS